MRDTLAYEQKVEDLKQEGLPDHNARILAAHELSGFRDPSRYPPPKHDVKAIFKRVKSLETKK